MFLNRFTQYKLQALLFLMILCPLLGQTQVYEEMIDSSDHALAGIVVPSGHSAPYFCDTDRDGDMDMISGAANGMLYFYENIGTEEQAIFDSVGINKLFDDDLWKRSELKVGFGKFSKPSGVDHDDDGDLDLFCGTKDSGIYYFKSNTGVSGPLQINHIYAPTDSKNPLRSVDKTVYNFIAPAFYDKIVNANPWACFGSQNGDIINYLEYNDSKPMYYPIKNGELHNLTPAIGDINADSHVDLILGNKDGSIIYFPGDSYEEVFGFDFESTSTNPFSQVQVDSFSTPALVDIDGDGDLDLFVGQADGTFKHFKNVSPDDYIKVSTDNFLHVDANHSINGSAAVMGNLGIGMAPTSERLAVKGAVTADDYKSNVSNPPDYVFYEDYQLRTLDEVRKYIDNHGHLPDIPSAIEMERNGVMLGEMSMSLLKKIEELTLYIMELKVEINVMKKQINENE